MPLRVLALINLNWKRDKTDKKEENTKKNHVQMKTKNIY